MTEHTPESGDPGTSAEPVGEPDADHVRTRLSLIGEQITVDSPSDELIGVEQAARRRRRGRVAAGVIGAAVLVVGGVVAVNLVSTDNSGSIQSSADSADESASDPDDANGGAEGGDDAGDAATDDAESESAAPDTAAPDTAVDDTAAPAPPPSQASAAGERSVVVAASAVEVGVDVGLMPWADGFLRVQTTWPLPVFPTDIPDDISALFSDEVTALIETEQPATIDEAMQLLSEAGLLSEVTEVFNEHPEVNEIFFGGETTEPVITTDFSTDGVDWSPIELNLPPVGDMGHQLQSNGTHLAMTQVDFAAEPSQFGGPSGIESITVFLTSDLVNWTEIDVPTPAAPVDMPDFMRWSAWPEQLVMSDTGWALSVQGNVEPDIERIFADELAELDVFNSGYGIGPTPGGIELEVYDDATGESVRVVRTWEELGTDPLPMELLWGGGSATIVSGTFDGGVNPAYEAAGWGQLSGFSGGFLRLGEVTELSVDGATWTAIDPPAGEYFGSGVMVERNGTVVAFASDDYRDPALAYELDVEAGFWRPTDGPELPPGSQGGFFGPLATSLSGVAIYGADEMLVAEPEPFEATGSREIDGYTFTLTMTESGQWYSLADADGAVVVEEGFDHETADWESPTGPFQHLRYGDFGEVTIVDPATGDTLVDIGSDVMADLSEELFRSMPGFDDPGMSPEQRLLATDGERWIDESLQPAFAFPEEGGSMPTEVWTSGVAMNGDLILVAFSDGSIERFTF